MSLQRSWRGELYQTAPWGVLREPRRDVDLRLQRPVHRTAVRHLQQAQPLGLGEGAGHLDLAVDVVDLPLLDLTTGAVEGVDPRVAEPHADPFQGDALAVRVEPQRHRGAGAEGAEDQLVRGRALDGAYD